MWYYLRFEGHNRFRVFKIRSLWTLCCLCNPVDRLRLCLAASLLFIITPAKRIFSGIYSIQSVCVFVRVSVCPQNTSNFVSRNLPTVLLQIYSNFAHTLWSALTCFASCDSHFYSFFSANASKEVEISVYDHYGLRLGKPSPGKKLGTT